jgi:hypothetical protein
VQKQGRARRLLFGSETAARHLKLDFGIKVLPVHAFEINIFDT